MTDSNWKEIYRQKLTTASEAVKCVKSGDDVYIGTASSTAYGLCRALGERTEELTNVRLCCANIGKPLRIFQEPEHFSILTYFMGPMERMAQPQGNVDYTSVHLSQNEIWCRETCPPDVAFMEVSLPDEYGYCSFGASGVALSSYLLKTDCKVVLQVNRHVPYVFGEENLIHVSEADYIVEYDEELFEVGNIEKTHEIELISGYILDKIPDGSCLQLGIGGIANAVGFGLKDRNDLGVHTEMMNDALAFLIKNGNVTNKYKGNYKGKSVATFSLGTKDMYQFLDHNPNIYFLPYHKVNRPSVIAANDHMVSVNGCISLDLTGQVVADNIAGRQYSGVGGQLDFVQGAQMARHGQSFIAATSVNVSKRTGAVTSRIVSRFPEGTRITTPSSEVQYVVTEYGCVNLKPLSMNDRVRAMISLAHPDFRDQLREEAVARGLL